MADVLKQTLYWSGNPAFTLVDNSAGACPPTEARAITAAESHDANDATYESVIASGDGVEFDPDYEAHVSRAIDTASVTGTISFIRMRARARFIGNGDTSNVGSWQPRINGTDRGSSAGLTGSFADYSQDFTTDPADSNPWTNAKLNAQTFGLHLRAAIVDTDHINSADIRLSEFSVEVWGPDVQTMTPAGATVALAVSAGALVAGLVAVSCDPAPVNTTPTAPTLVPGPVALALDSAGVDSLGLDEAWVLGIRDPLTPVDVDAFVDAGPTPVRIVRSDTAPFDDGNDATKTLLSSPGTWPNSGTMLFDFHGTQGETSLDGTGPIAGVKLYVRVRARKDPNAVLNNFRPSFSGLTKAFVAQPTVYPMAPASAFYETLATDLIPLTSNGVPFEWGQGTNSIFTQAVLGWVLSVDYSVGGAFTGEFAQVECSDAWLEVYAPQGSEPEIIELKHKVGNMRRVQAFPQVVGEE